MQNKFVLPLGFEFIRFGGHQPQRTHVCKNDGLPWSRRLPPGLNVSNKECCSWQKSKREVVYSVVMSTGFEDEPHMTQYLCHLLFV